MGRLNRDVMEESPERANQIKGKSQNLQYTVTMGSAGQRSGERPENVTSALSAYLFFRPGFSSISWVAPVTLASTFLYINHEHMAGLLGYGIAAITLIMMILRGRN